MEFCDTVQSLAKIEVSQQWHEMSFKIRQMKTKTKNSEYRAAIFVEAVCVCMHVRVQTYIMHKVH